MSARSMPVKADERRLPGRVAVGDRFHRLVVIGLIPDRKNPKALCLCDCGNTATPQRGSLKNGRAKSCGCIRIEEFIRQRAAQPTLPPMEAHRRRAACSDRWHKANRDKARAASRKHYLLHKAAVKSHHHARRARLKGATGGHFDRAVEQRLFAMQLGKCAVCGIRLKKTGHHVDHVTPISKGGRHENKNLQLLCPSCNLSKGAKDPLTFMQLRGYLL